MELDLINWNFAIKSILNRICDFIIKYICKKKNDMKLDFKFNLL